MRKIAFLMAIAAAVYVLPAQAATSSVNETIGIGKTLSVGLNPTGTWQINQNSNPAVAQAAINGLSVVVTGLTAGSSSINACTADSSDCVSITVNVSAVLGASTAIGAHPAGTWIIQGKTVFYVHSTGIIPVTTYSIFLNNGGKNAKLEQMNSADEHLPLLPFMVNNDPRLK